MCFHCEIVEQACKRIRGGSDQYDLTRSILCAAAEILAGKTVSDEIRNYGRQSAILQDRALMTAHFEECYAEAVEDQRRMARSAAELPANGQDDVGEGIIVRLGAALGEA